MSGKGVENAERAANFKSKFLAGNGLIYASGTRDLIQAGVDASLMDVADGPGCKQP